VSGAALQTTDAMGALLPTLQLALRGALALLLLAAAAHKIRDLADFERVVGAYELMPRIAAGWAARAIPALEVTGAALLCVPATVGVGAALAFVLLGAYSAALALSLARGRRDIDCGCGGFGAKQSIHFGLLLRNGALLLAASFCGLPLPGPAAQLSAALPAALAAVLLYAATDQLMANGAFRRSLVYGRSLNA
jgi:hypothetical protein